MASLNLKADRKNVINLADTGRNCVKIYNGTIIIKTPESKKHKGGDE